MKFVLPLAVFALVVSPSLAQSAVSPSGAVGASEIYQPAANPEAEVVIGHARITVLTPQLLRLEWAADGRFEDHASFAFLQRRLPVPAFTQKVEGKGKARELLLDTAELHLRYKAGAEGEAFSAENLSIRLTVAGEEVEWHPGMADTGNLMGTARTLDGVKGDDVKLEPGLLSRNGWALVDDSERPLFDSSNFAMAKGMESEWPWYLQRPAGKRDDWYFFGYGHEYSKAMGDFVRVAGRIPLPPRFAFGTWWSRYWAYSDQELQELIDGYHEHKLPLDVLVIDMDWHIAVRGRDLDPSGHRKGWTGYTWNKNLFPEPQRFLESVHDQGLKVTLNLHPASGVQPFEEAYPAMAKAMGQDPKEGKYVPFQIASRKYVENYFSILHHPLEKQGVDFWWLDWQQEAKTEVAGLSPTFWLNYLHFTDQEREGKRPMLFHRWGGLGNHRYQIGFSGDTKSVWESLQFQPSFTATAANVGYAFWSHDIGGHMPGAIEPELYLRWLQFGAFSPILRTHTTKNPDAERRVWAYPEPYSDIMEDTVRQRAAWIPYIYTEARRTYDTGVAFLRPLYYGWPEADEAYKSPNEFLFGENVIVAPVTTPVDAVTQQAQESVWLPEGEWVESSTGKHLVGPVRTTRSYSLAETPVFRRVGAIVPMQPPMSHVGALPVDPLIVQVTPLTDGQKSSYALYEDSSDGRGYEGSEFVRTPMEVSRDGATTTFTVKPVVGAYPGMLEARAFRIELPGDWPPTEVLVNGKPVAWQEKSKGVGWWFVGNTLTTTIQTASFPVGSETTIVVKRDAAMAAQSKLVDGFAGRMLSLRRAYGLMNDIWPINDLVAASQTGDRLGYHPERALAEVQQLPGLIASSQKDVDVFEAAEDAKAKEPVAAGVDSAGLAKKQEENRLLLKRVRAALGAAATQ